MSSANPLYKFKKKTALWLFSFFCVLLAACSDPSIRQVQIQGQTMGTTYHLTALDPESRLDTDKLKKLVDLRLQQINQSMSTYIDDSELSQFNHYPINEWFEASDDFFAVLMLATEVAWMTAGAFDITVGPLVDLWGFGPGRDVMADPVVPSDEEIKTLSQRIGYQQLELDLARAAVLKKSAVQIDLSAVAKGFAVDEIAFLLEQAGVANYLIEIGGELRTRGHNSRRQPWRIAIEEPGSGFGEVHQAINVSGVAMATSGDYRNYFEKDGRRYSHTIDPTTGRPIDHRLASVTVIDRSTAFADAMATALNVLGHERGWQLAQEQGMAVYMIIKEGSGFKSRYTAGFEPYLESPTQP